MGLGHFLKTAGKRAVGIRDIPDETMPVPQYNPDTAYAPSNPSIPSALSATTQTDQPMPVYNPPTGMMDESLVRQRPLEPTPTLADQYTANAVPMEETVRPRYNAVPASVDTPLPKGVYKTAPNAIPAGADYTHAYPVYGNKAQPLRGEGGKTELENQQAYLESLNAYKPTDHNGRGKSALIDAGRAYLHGGGLVGALTGAVRGLVDPGADERYQNDVDRGRTGQAVAQGLSYQKAQSDADRAAAESDYNRAQAERELRPPVYAPETVDTAEGLGVLNKNNATITPVYNPGTQERARKSQTTTHKTEIRHDAQGKAEKWTIGANGEPDTKVEGWTDTSKDLVNVNGRLVPQSTAVTAEALGGQRGYQQNRDTVKDAEHKTERQSDQEEKALKAAEDRGVKAAAIVARISKGRETAMDAEKQMEETRKNIEAAKAKNDVDRQQKLQDQYVGWERIRSDGLADASTAATELSQGYGDIYEAGVGTRGFAYFQAKPFSRSEWRKNYKFFPPGTSAADRKRIEDLHVEAARKMNMPIVD